MAGDGDRTLKHKGSGYEGGPLERPEMAIAKGGAPEGLEMAIAP